MPSREKAIENDLTKGDAARQLIRYAIPMVTTSVLQALYSMADMIIAGHFIGNTGISAINNSSQIMNIATQIAIGLTVGGNVLIGQYYGAGKQEERRRAIGTLLTSSLLLGVFGLLLIFSLARAILSGLGAPALDDAEAYLQVCAFGMPFIFGYNALSAVLRAIGNSRKPLHFIAASASTNVVLDIVFVGGLKMGVRGAALATVLSQGLSFSLALIFLLRHSEIFRISLENLKIRAAELKMIFKLGIPSSLQHTIGGISWLVVTFLINSYGVDVSAGNGVSVKIKDFCQLFISAMSSGAATMIAQTLGAKMYDRAKEVMYTAMKITMLMAVTMIIIVELLAPQLAAIFTGDPAVQAAAVMNLRIEILGQIFYAVFFVYHSLAIGAGHTLFAMSSSFVNCILFRVVLAITFNHFFGLPGIYWACMIAPSVSVPLGWLYTRSNVWRRSLA